MKKNRSGFTLIELLVVIAIIALLLSILLPSLKKAKVYAQEIVCRAHLKSLAIAGTVYAHDNDSKLVECHAQTSLGTGSYAVYILGTPEPWRGAGNFFKHGLIEVPKIFYCPSNTNKTLKYGKDHPEPGDRGGGWPLGRIPKDLFPGQYWVQTTYHYRSLWDGHEWRQLNTAKDSGGMAFMADMFADPSRGVDFHHKDSYNAAYLDGHSGTVDEEVAYIDGKETKVIRDFNNGSRYHAGSTGYQLQDWIWKRYFDIKGGGVYPEK